MVPGLVSCISSPILSLKPLSLTVTYKVQTRHKGQGNHTFLYPEAGECSLDWGVCVHARAHELLSSLQPEGTTQSPEKGGIPAYSLCKQSPAATALLIPSLG